MWNIINEANNRNYVMCCGAVGYKIPQNKNVLEGKTPQGLVTRHAYSLIDTYNYNGQLFCKLRNPWGSFEWNGPWGDSDTRWTP